MSLIPKIFPRQARSETQARIEIFKNSYDGVLYYKDRYNNLIPIAQGDTSIYSVDGTLTGDRLLTGANHFLHFKDLSDFTVDTAANINLGPGGEVLVSNTKSISFDNPTGSVTALKVRSSVSTYLSFENTSVGTPPSKVRLSGVDGIELYNNSGKTIIENNLAYYSGTGNSIANITADLNPKVIPSREWVNNAISLTPSIYTADGSLTGNRTVTLGAFDLIFDGDGVNPPMLYLDASVDNVGIGAAPSAYRLDVSGDQRITGALTLGTPLDIANGGTGQITPQLATNALTRVGAATNEHVLTKDTGTGDAVWKAATGAASSIYTASGTIPTTTVATVTDTVNFSGGRVGINVAPGVYDFQVAGVQGASVSKLNINSAYSFPTTVAPADNGKALTYNSGTGNLEFATIPNIYTTNGTVGTTRVATLTDILTWNAGSVRRTANLTAIIEVTQESDFGTAVAGVITLPANTTYQIIGSVTCSNRLDISVEGISIIGNNRQLDKLTYTGTGDFITVTDVNFTINDIWLASTNSSSLLIRASNVAASGFNNGRTRVLEIVNCQFRNCYNVMNVDGFDLVDISNTLFFYIQAPSIGLSFRDTSKLEISSCELIRWYDETTNGTANPPGWATCSMIELRANNLASFGAVNVNGCIIHPQQTQNGIDIKAGSSTGFGTISSSAFVNTGLAGGRVFLANALTPALGGYSQTEALTYDVFSNQGIPNSSAYGNFHIGAATGFDTNTGAGGATWLQVAYPSTPAASNEQRFTFTSPTVPRVGGTAQGGLLTYDGTKTIFVTITCTVVYNDTGGGNNAFEFGIAKNKVTPTFTPEVASVLPLLIGGGAYNAATLVYTDTITTGDDFQLVVQNISSLDNIEIISTQFLIKE